MRITIGDLGDSRVRSLLIHHVEDLRSKGLPESSFVLDLTALQAPNITLFTAWDGDDLLGCGALKQLNPDTGEIKSMRTAPGHIRKGVGKAIAQHIILEGKRRNYTHIYLETGTGTAFADAQRLYKRLGFKQCEPFSDYVAHEDNMFLVLELYV